MQRENKILTYYLNQKQVNPRNSMFFVILSSQRKRIGFKVCLQKLTLWDRVFAHLWNSLVFQCPAYFGYRFEWHSIDLNTQLFHCCRNVFPLKKKRKFDENFPKNIRLFVIKKVIFHVLNIQCNKRFHSKYINRDE